MSSGNKHQCDYRFIDSFLQKIFDFFSATVFQISRRNNLQASRTFLILMMPIHNKHQHDYRLIDGAFHQNFEIHVNSLNRGNQHSNKDKFPYSGYVIMLNMHQYDVNKHQSQWLTHICLLPQKL